MKIEIKKLFFFPSGRYMPCGLDIIEQIWWRFVPGVVIKVRWPNGWAVLDDDGHEGKTGVESADPNDHYRPFLEKYVGKQGWDWNWGVADRDAAENQLTIKIRKKHKKYATIISLRWA